MTTFEIVLVITIAVAGFSTGVFIGLWIWEKSEEDSEKSKEDSEKSKEEENNPPMGGDSE
jgi:hypothetical protein